MPVSNRMPGDGMALWITEAVSRSFVNFPVRETTLVYGKVVKGTPKKKKYGILRITRKATLAWLLVRQSSFERTMMTDNLIYRSIFWCGVQFQ